MNLWQKIIEVRKIADGFKKDGNSNGVKYVSGNQILRKIEDVMNEQSLILQPSAKLGHHETYDYKTKAGKEKTDFIVKGDMSYTWINADKPDEREVVEWAYYGQQDDISKAFGSALTYSERYFLLKYFGLPTDEDDPDAKEKEKGNKDPVVWSKESLITFGKHNGKTISQIWKEDKQYLEYLSKSAKEKDFKDYLIKILKGTKEESKVDKEGFQEVK